MYISDRVCLPITQCFTTPLNETGTRFQTSAAQNATASFTGNNSGSGSDALCQRFSTCPGGMYVFSKGNAYTNVSCAKCLPGTYGTDSNPGVCTSCTKGDTYQPNQGAAACLPCTVCNNASTNVTNQTFQCADEQKPCTVAYHSVCTVTSNSVCIECPNSAFRLSVYATASVCNPCADGYYDVLATAQTSTTQQAAPGIIQWSANQSIIDLLRETQRCVQCAANYYCSSSVSFELCQDLVVYSTDGKIIHQCRSNRH